MKQIKLYTILPITVISIILTACSQKENIAVSDIHAYNENYGVLDDKKVDEIIAKEIEIANSPIETDYSSCDPKYETEPKEDPDAFLAKDWVQPKPKVYYKYMDDPKFYSEDELPENKLRTGNTIIKVPKKKDTNLLYSKTN
jgi:hypothetical protein